MVIKKQAALRVGGVIAAMAVAVSPILASAATQNANTDINASIGETISISTSGTVNLTLNPGNDEFMSVGADTVTVSSNNTDGYFLELNDSDTNNSLVSDESNSIDATAGSTASPSQLGENTWGYAVAGSPFASSYVTGTGVVEGSMVFAEVPTSSASGALLNNTSSVAVNDITTVYYGVKVNTAQPTGTYTGTVTYTATTN